MPIESGSCTSHELRTPNPAADHVGKNDVYFSNLPPRNCSRAPLTACLVSSLRVLSSFRVWIHRWFSWCWMCGIDVQSANLEIAARRIVYSKNLNCGQLCIGPDYVLVHEKVKMVPRQAMIPSSRDRAVLSVAGAK